MSTSPASDSRQTLGQFAIAVVALIVGTAVLFFAIGAVGSSSDDESAAGATTAATTDSASDETPAATASETEPTAQVVGPSDAATTPAPETLT